jgi:hypothetical protein
MHAHDFGRYVHELSEEEGPTFSRCLFMAAYVRFTTDNRIRFLCWRRETMNNAKLFLW